MTIAPQTSLGTDVLAHLDAQLRSARRLLGFILHQGSAIRRRDVGDVLATMTDIQSEMSTRSGVERERQDLLQRAGSTLGLAAELVTLEDLMTLISPPEATAALERSTLLRGLLSELSREHTVNRALMRQELSFLEHLTRMLGANPEATGYRRAGHAPRSSPSAALHVVDLEA